MQNDSEVSEAKAGNKTIVMAKMDVGFGNNLFIRGDNPALDWSNGSPMYCIAADQWIWSTDKADHDFVCKFLINDEIWSSDEDISIKAGQKTVCLPKFVITDS